MKSATRDRKLRFKVFASMSSQVGNLLTIVSASILALTTGTDSSVQWPDTLAVMIFLNKPATANKQHRQN